MQEEMQQMQRSIDLAAIYDPMGLLDARHRSLGDVWRFRVIRPMKGLSYRRTKQIVFDAAYLHDPILGEVEA
ncbi:hypothetical protein FQN49_006959 [Arthroderma sp. PD_2]|nr:hypothetical protein FQN49_006959 [Arthroderma sp. PD_2]